MVDNEILKRKLKKQLKHLHLDKDEERVVVGELNYLSNLLIDIYIKEKQNDKRETIRGK
jgi:hypothetical protein